MPSLPKPSKRGAALAKAGNNNRPAKDFDIGKLTADALNEAVLEEDYKNPAHPVGGSGETND